MGMKNNLEIFKKSIDQAQSISICSHISPDGDAVGSSTGLYLALKEMGKDVYLVKNDDFPSNLEFVKHEDFYTGGQAFETDLFIVTDVSSDDRIGNGIEFHKLAKNSLCIDHHKTNDGFFPNCIIESTLSSTCELIAAILFEGEYKISPLAATFLYLGISTDTHRFQYESTSAETLRIAAKLIDLGADKKMINLALYESLNVNYLLLQAEVINSATRFHDGKFIIASLTNDQLDKYGLDHDETEGLVSILKSITGIEVACLVKEHEELDQKISFRSKETVDVSAIAQEFGGGGHIRASGCTILSNNKDAFDKVYERLKRV